MMRVFALCVVLLAAIVAVILVARGRGSATSRQSTTLVPGRDVFVYLLPIHGGASVNLTRRRRFPYDAEDPAWSPDGKQIAFSNVGASGRSEIYVMNADGTGERKLVGMGGDLFSPTWSPDGRRVAFMSNVNRQQGVYSPYAVRTDGHGLTRLTDAVAADSGPAWSPDGKEIAFSRRPLIPIVDKISR